MPQTTLKLSVIATLLLLAGGISAQAADETFTVRIENVSAADALKLSNAARFRSSPPLLTDSGVRGPICCDAQHCPLLSFVSTRGNWHEPAAQFLHGHHRRSGYLAAQAARAAGWQGRAVGER